MLHSKEKIQWNIAFASEEDIPAWMELVRQVIDGFPNMQENEYMGELRRWSVPHRTWAAANKQ